MASTPTTSSPLMIIRSTIGSKDAAMALTLVVIVGLLILPLPPILLDVMIALNLALSIGVLLLSMYISQPMDFSSFPTVLLLVTMFRLGLNISTSRLILLSGDAGKVVSTFGSMLMGGNYIVGIVVFLMLMIIQFVVINTGAGRVAEVAARFTLDAMPGKQLSIDADLNAGLIDETQARARRKAIETEAGFYGAMDGASKFVRGDAIAAIIVMLVNIIGGVIIGILQRNLDAMQALQSYAVLTVGAGLAVQIPALLISSATGLIVTRTSSVSSLGNEIFGQISNFKTLVMATGLVSLLVLIPGLPKLPFMIVAGLLGAATYMVWRTNQKEEIAAQAPAPTQSTELESPEDMLDMVVVDPIEMEIGYALIPLIDEDAPDNILRRVTGIRRQIMAELGLILPIVRIRDNLRLQPQAYRIKLRGQEVARGELFTDRMLAIPGSEADEALRGTKTTEPAFGLPALWISEAESGRAELMGYTVVNPLSVLSTHLTEVVRGHASDLLSRQMVQEMLNQLKNKMPAAVEGVVPEMISLGEVQAVFRNLLQERVPIRDIPGILEVLANNAPMTRDPNVLAEAVRHSMAGAISGQYRDDDGYLHVMTVSPQLETALRGSLGASEGGLSFQIDTGTAQTILYQTGKEMEKLAQLGHLPILLCPRELRLAFRRLVEHSLPNLVVLAFSEVSAGTKVRAHGMVALPEAIPNQE